MKVEIEIEIPDGHELVSHRLSSVCDNISHGLEERSYHVYSRPSKPFLINGVPSDWPEWLACDWVARDQGGRVWAYNCEPEKRTSDWYSVHGCYLLSGAIHIDIPGDWTQSKRENPRRKNKEVSE